MDWLSNLKSAGLLTTMLIFGVTTAEAQVITDAKSLRQRCASVHVFNPTAGLGCRAYIGAIVDSLEEDNTVYGLRACLPVDLEREAVIRAVTAWIDQHPDALDQRAALAVVQALAAAYPCPAAPR